MIIQGLVEKHQNTNSIFDISHDFHTLSLLFGYGNLCGVNISSLAHNTIHLSGYHVVLKQ